MWQSLFFDLYSTLYQNSKDLTEAVVLSVHLFNVSKDLQCTGLSENDQVGYEILPKGWNLNQQLFSFRYSVGEVNIYQKFLRISEEKLNIYTIRGDKTEELVNYSVDLTTIDCQLQGTEFVKELMEKVLKGYEVSVLTELDIVHLQEEKEEKEKVTETENEESGGLVKQKSLLEDESIPFGQPVDHSAGTHPAKASHFAQAHHSPVHPPPPFAHPPFHSPFPAVPLFGYPPYPFYPGYQYPPNYQQMATFPHFNPNQVKPKKQGKTGPAASPSQYSYPYYPGYY